MPRFVSKILFPLGFVASTVVLLLGSCTTTIGPTHVQIFDSLRHYYPVLMGQEMRIRMEVHNIGHEPLIIDDIQPSWGPSFGDENASDKREDGSSTYGIIPPDKKQVFFFRYPTSLNSGQVSHDIRLYGNLIPNGVATLHFDVNIVPPTESSLDYEENHYDEVKHTETVRQLIDGEESERGYYVNEEDY